MRFSDKVSGNLTSVFEWEYTPEMTPVPLELIQRFIDGKASYADVLGASGEVTSGEAMLRKTKRDMGMRTEWDQ